MFNPEIENLESRINPGADAPLFHSDILLDLHLDNSYPSAQTLTLGIAKPWYASTKVQQLYGHPLTPKDKLDFVNNILKLTRETFSLSGIQIKISLSTDKNVGAPHTVSLVSNASSRDFPGAIGETLLGGDGFSFIDKEIAYAHSRSELEIIVAHNIAHEIMLALGVPENISSQAGRFIDDANISLTAITNSNTKFSPAAIATLNRLGLGQ